MGPGMVHSQPGEVVWSAGNKHESSQRLSQSCSRSANARYECGRDDGRHSSSVLPYFDRARRNNR